MTSLLRAVACGLLAVPLLPLLHADGVKFRVLVYTRNFTPDNRGFVHDNIAASVEAIRRMGRENGFAVDVSEDPKVFTDAGFGRRYKAVIFSNSNNEAFENDSQREAFRRYIQGGGGWVGIHSATGSERKWPYFWSMAGAKFLRHPQHQDFVVRVADRNHPATRGMPAEFRWSDECYYMEHLKRDVRVLLTTDPKALKDPEWGKSPGDLMGNVLPLAWCQRFDGGREFYTALGHDKEHYSNPVLYRHILGGILWAAGVKE